MSSSANRTFLLKQRVVYRICSLLMYSLLPIEVQICITLKLICSVGDIAENIILCAGLFANVNGFDSLTINCCDWFNAERLRLVYSSKDTFCEYLIIDKTNCAGNASEKFCNGE